MSSTQTHATILALLQASSKVLEAAMNLMEAPACTPSSPPCSPPPETDNASVDGWPNYEVELDLDAMEVDENAMEVDEVLVPQPEPEPKVKKDKRVFSKLPAALPFGTSVSITSSGDTMTAVYTQEGFKVGEVHFPSPMAFGRAHASRITEAHPKETKAGNGWVWITVDDGEHAGKTIGQVYDEHYA
jgi:hypothetical protein